MCVYVLVTPSFFVYDTKNSDTFVQNNQQHQNKKKIAYAMNMTYKNTFVCTWGLIIIHN